MKGGCWWTMECGACDPGKAGAQRPPPLLMAMRRQDRLAETRRIIERTILVRRVSLGVFCLVALIVVLFSEISPLNPLFSVPFAWLRMGGVEWIGVVFYLFTVMYANFFLPKVAGYVVTGLAIGSYAAVAFLEYFGVIPHYRLFQLVGQPHRYLPYVVTTVLAGGVGLYSILAFTVRAFAGIYERFGARGGTSPDCPPASRRAWADLGRRPLGPGCREP